MDQDLGCWGVRFQGVRILATCEPPNLFQTSRPRGTAPRALELGQDQRCTGCQGYTCLCKYSCPISPARFLQHHEQPREAPADTRVGVGKHTRATTGCSIRSVTHAPAGCMTWWRGRSTQGGSCCSPHVFVAPRAQVLCRAQETVLEALLQSTESPNRGAHKRFPGSSPWKRPPPEGLKKLPRASPSKPEPLLKQRGAGQGRRDMSGLLTQE